MKWYVFVGIILGAVALTMAVMFYEPNAVNVISKSGDFDTFTVAMKEAGLEGILSGRGPFTVFAPTDEAFAKIPRDVLEELLNDKPRLTRVLMYHIVPGKLMLEDIMFAEYLTTLEGGRLLVSCGGGNLLVENAGIVKTEIMTTNGLIYAIDTVLIPAE